MSIVEILKTHSSSSSSLGDWSLSFVSTSLSSVFHHGFMEAARRRSSRRRRWNSVESLRATTPFTLSSPSIAASTSHSTNYKNTYSQSYFLPLTQKIKVNMFLTFTCHVNQSHLCHHNQSRYLCHHNQSRHLCHHNQSCPLDLRKMDPNG